MKYKLIIVVVLLLGIISVVSAEISDDYGGSRSIRLREGWNLVTIYTLEEMGTRALGDGSPKDISVAFIYDRYVGEYVRTYPKAEENKIKRLFTTMGDPEKGGDIGEYGGFVNSSMWIYSKKDQTINYHSVDGPLQHKYVNIRSGWNFLSVTPEYIGKSLKQLKGSCEFAKIYSYSRDGGDARWVDMLNDTNFFNNEKFDESSVGAGFVVKVANSCKMGSNVLIPTVPPLPN